MSSNTKNNTSQKSLRFFGTFLAVISLITFQTSTVLADAKEGGYPEPFSGSGLTELLAVQGP